MNVDDLIRRLEGGETSLALDQEISRALGFGGGSVVPPYSRPGLFFHDTEAVAGQARCCSKLIR
jgi:hypothetical protein